MVVQKDDDYPFELTFNHYEGMPPVNEYKVDWQSEFQMCVNEFRVLNLILVRRWQADPKVSTEGR